MDAQYKAIADYELASDVDVTASAEWSVEPNDNCSIAAGLLTTEMIDLPTDIIITAEKGPNYDFEEYLITISSTTNRRPSCSRAVCQ